MQQRTYQRLGEATVVLLAVLAYGISLQNELVFDDATLIGENHLIRDLRNLPAMLTTDYWGTLGRPDLFAGTALYRPLVIVSLAFNYAIGGLHPAGYHLLNLLLHAGVSLAVLAVGRRLSLGDEAATLAAVVFAVHPLHTEAVVYVVGRAELLMALGVLWGLHEYIRGRAFASLLAFAVALLAKEQAIVFPVVLLLYDVCLGGGFVPGVRAPLKGAGRSTPSQRNADKSPGRAAVVALTLRLLPFAALLVMYVIVRTAVLGLPAAPATTVLDNPLAQAPLGARLLTAFAVSARYLWLCVWPFPLSPDYSFNQIPMVTSPFDLWVALAGAAWVSLAYLTWRSARGGSGVAAFAVGFTALTFLLASNLLVPIGTVMGERLFYLPSVGLCWLVGIGWEVLRLRAGGGRTWRVVAPVGVAAVVVCLTVLSMNYSRVWRDPLTLYRHAVTVAPESAKMRYFLASFLMASSGDAALEATEHLRKAVEILPGFGEAWDALGRSLLAAGQPADAVVAFERAAALNLRNPRYQTNLGVAYKSAGRWDDAIAAFRRAIALEPWLVPAHRNLADAYTWKGFTRAGQAQALLAQNPNDARAWTQAGAAFLELQWLDESARAFEYALRLDPRLAEAQRGLEETRRMKAVIK